MKKTANNLKKKYERHYIFFYSENMVKLKKYNYAPDCNEYNVAITSYLAQISICTTMKPCQIYENIL